jgi:NAD(P)-dependent dehydrogenase (short-subunit alcohol dehydrogenase family)
MSVDLGNMASIRKFAQEFISTKKPLDILINNAGIMAGPLEKTSDGFEAQFGVNHLGHFLLTNLLLPVLIKSGSKAHPAIVINLTSMAALLFGPKQGILFDDLDGSKYYQKWERYGQSKVANILFTNERNKRMKENGHDVVSISVHPGYIAETNLGRSLDLHSLAAFFWQVKKSRIYMLAGSKNLKQGTATTIVCALDPNVQPDRYYEDCNVSDRVHHAAFDKDIMAKLWTVSASMVGL